MPSAAVLTGTILPSSTVITITGSIPSGTVVTGFEVRWQRDTSAGCSDEDKGTMFVAGPFSSYQISALEPGNRYTITVTVSNAAGTAPAINSVTGTTLETGRRECHLHCVCLLCYMFYILHSSQCWSSLSHSWYCYSITVQWEEVPCLHRNGEITGYTIVVRASGDDDRVINVDDGREAIISGLNRNTLYSVNVIAGNGAGTGPASSIDIETAGVCVVQDWNVHHNDELEFIPIVEFIATVSLSTNSLTIFLELLNGVTATAFTISGQLETDWQGEKSSQQC